MGMNFTEVGHTGVLRLHTTPLLTWGADGGGGVHVGYGEPLGSQAVYVGGLSARLTVPAQVTPAHLSGKRGERREVGGLGKRED